jgi:hypothetical protein
LGQRIGRFRDAGLPGFFGLRIRGVCHGGIVWRMENKITNRHEFARISTNSGTRLIRVDSCEFVQIRDLHLIE